MQSEDVFRLGCEPSKRAPSERAHRVLEGRVVPPPASPHPPWLGAAVSHPASLSLSICGSPRYSFSIRPPRTHASRGLPGPVHTRCDHSPRRPCHHHCPQCPPFPSRLGPLHPRGSVNDPGSHMLEFANPLLRPAVHDHVCSARTTVRVSRTVVFWATTCVPAAPAEPGLPLLLDLDVLADPKVVLRLPYSLSQIPSARLCRTPPS